MSVRMDGNCIAVGYIRHRRVTCWMAPRQSSEPGAVVADECRLVLRACERGDSDSHLVTATEFVDCRTIANSPSTCRAGRHATASTRCLNMRSCIPFGMRSNLKN